MIKKNLFVTSTRIKFTTTIYIIGRGGGDEGFVGVVVGVGGFGGGGARQRHPGVVPAFRGILSLNHVFQRLRT